MVSGGGGGWVCGVVWFGFCFFLKISKFQCGSIFAVHYGLVESQVISLTAVGLETNLLDSV